MPKSLIRALLVLLVSLVVPIQGVAAAGADLCMALGHHDGLAAHDHAAPVHDGHDADAGAADHHGPAGGGNSHDAHCPPCVSCCAAAAIATSSPALFVPEKPATSVVAAVLPQYSGVVPDSLDRPPLAL